MVQFEINQQAGKAITRKMVQTWLDKIVKTLKIKSNFEISFGVVGDTAIRQMNKSYRGKDKVTDVLSFPEKNSLGRYSAQGYLGEIIICYPQTVRRAKKAGHTVAQELELLFVHGFMHLLGYDHETVAQAKKMEKLEERILASRG